MNIIRRVLVLVAFGAAVGGVGSTAATAVGEPTMTLTQKASTALVGGNHTVTAVVRDADGRPVADGVVVRFTTGGDDGSVPPEMVSMAAPPAGNGYWLADAAGHVSAFGSATHQGDLANRQPRVRAAGVAATFSGGGYWLATEDGKVFPFGDAGSTMHDTGSLGGDAVVGIAAASGGGWVVRASGTVQGFGSVTSLGGWSQPPAPVRGIVATATGAGYRLFTSTGAVAVFGDAVFRGDMSNVRLNKPVAGLVNYGSYAYLLVGNDGGIFNFSDRPFAGSLGANPPAHPVITAIGTSEASGYWMLGVDGQTYHFGAANNYGSLRQSTTVDGKATFTFTSLAAGSTTVTATALTATATIAQTWSGTDIDPSPDTTTTTTTITSSTPTTSTTSTPTTRPQTAPNPPSTTASTDVESGYWALSSDGTVYNFGDAPNIGRGMAGAVDLEPTPTGKGYWTLNQDGHVQAHGDATKLGDVDITKLAKDELPASLSGTPSGKGYWVFTNRGRAIAYGDAAFLGDVSAIKLNGPVLGSVATPSGNGYYMVASDGGIFAFGDAAFIGSMGGQKLNAPVQSLVPDSDGKGYWLVASDGGIFAFDAPFRGSMGGTKLNRPVAGMVRYGDGYLMVGADGGIFNFSSLPFSGSLGDKPPAAPVVAVAALP